MNITSVLIEKSGSICAFKSAFIDETIWERIIRLPIGFPCFVARAGAVHVLAQIVLVAEIRGIVPLWEYITHATTRQGKRRNYSKKI